VPNYRQQVDGKGARILRLRIEIGARPGGRVVVISAAEGAGVNPGDRGTLLEIGEADARVAFDLGGELVVDTSSVRLRAVTDPV
jgi:hypothetical protein